MEGQWLVGELNGRVDFGREWGILAGGWRGVATMRRVVFAVEWLDGFGHCHMLLHGE